MHSFFFNALFSVLEDQKFTGEYYKWKKIELKHPKKWNLK